MASQSDDGEGKPVKTKRICNRFADFLKSLQTLQMRFVYKSFFDLPKALKEAIWAALLADWASQNHRLSRWLE